jgi:hypothetical protein
MEKVIVVPRVGTIWEQLGPSLRCLKCPEIVAARDDLLSPVTVTTGVLGRCAYRWRAAGGDILGYQSVRNIFSPGYP